MTNIRPERPDEGRVDQYPLGARIHFIRKKRGWSQQVFAKKCNLSQGALSQIEKSQIDPSLKTLKRIAQELRVHLAVLFASDDVHVFDMKKLKKDYRKSSDFTKPMRRAISQISNYIATLDKIP